MRVCRKANERPSQERWRPSWRNLGSDNNYVLTEPEEDQIPPPKSGIRLRTFQESLRYVTDSGGSLRFWHVFGMMQRPDLSEMMELGHD